MLNTSAQSKCGDRVHAHREDQAPIDGADRSADNVYRNDATRPR